MKFQPPLTAGAFFLSIYLIFIGNVANADVKQGLSEKEYQTYLTSVKKTPGNISKDQALIRKLSIPQWKNLVESFNITHFGFLYPARIKGEKIPSILGKKIADISVMAVWDGKMKPIPFQIDEFDKKSRYIYIPKVNKSPIDGTYLEIDPNDELIFLYRDASEKRYQAKSMQPKEGKVLRELKFTDRQGRNRYAYVVENNSERSEADYIDASVEEAKVVSSFYHLDYDPKNFLNFKDMRPHVGTASDQRVVDNIYFELSANVFSRFIKVGMNSADNVRIKVLGVKDGPVRATYFIKIVIVLAGKIPIFSMNSEISFYEQGMVMPNRTEVGKGAIFIKLFKNAEIIMYTDMNGIQGARVSAQAFEDEDGNRIYGIVDGKMDAAENMALTADVPGDWVWIESGLGWDVFMAFKLPMDELKGMESHVYYEDDDKSLAKHETFPGAGPRIGMIISGLPKDIKALETLDMEYSFWFPDTVGKAGPEEFNKEEQNRPTVEVIEVK